MYLPTTLGIPTIPPVYTVYHTQGVRCAPVPGEEALGSARRIIRGMRRIEALRTLRV